MRFSILRGWGTLQSRVYRQPRNFLPPAIYFVNASANWDPWEDAPVIDALLCFPGARMLLRRAKATASINNLKKNFACKLMELCEKSIQLRWRPTGYPVILYVPRQWNWLFPALMKIKSKLIIKNQLLLNLYPDTFYSYARFIYRRLKDYKKAEITFKEAGIRGKDKDKGKINIIGLHSFAEFYLSWPGHERQAGNLLNKIIGEEKNRVRNFFLAGRLYQQMGWQFLAMFFYEAALREDSKDIRTLNSYANACVEWKDKEKARGLFEKSLSINSNNVPTYNSYAMPVWNGRTKKKPGSCLKKALDIAPMISRL